MQIDDLTAGLSLSFLINLNTEQLQFESKILEVYPRKLCLLMIKLSLSVEKA